MGDGVQIQGSHLLTCVDVVVQVRIGGACAPSVAGCHMAAHAEPWIRLSAALNTLDRLLARAAPCHRSVPLEVIIRLANTLGADPWICIPHRATDQFVAGYAQASGLAACAATAPAAMHMMCQQCWCA